MKTLIRIAVTGMALFGICWAKEIPATPPGAVAREAPAWSVVYLADLEWTEAEVKQTVTLLEQIEPDLVVSLSPCPFAEAIRNLECKPKVLDQTQRAGLGVACGVPASRHRHDHAPPVQRRRTPPASRCQYPRDQADHRKPADFRQLIS